MPGNPLTDPDWATGLADTIVRNVAMVRDRTTRPVITAARAVVFGVIAAVGATVIGLLAVIAAVRGLISVLEWPFTHPTAVWLAYLCLGGIFLLAGALLMGRRDHEEPAA